MQLRNLGIVFVVAMVLVGLLSLSDTPDLRIGYYPSQARLSLKVMRTVACDSAGNAYLASAVLAQTSYASDRSRGYKKINVRDLDGIWSETESEFQFYEDGRLKSVNTTATGKGGELVKSAVSMASLSATRKLVSPSGEAVEPPADVCSRLALNETSDPVSITFEKTVTFEEAEDRPLLIPPISGDAKRHDLTKAAFGNLCVTINKVSSEEVPFAWKASPAKYPALPLIHPAVYEVIISQSRPVSDSASEDCDTSREPSSVLWSGQQQVPQKGEAFSLPVPKAPAWGGQKFQLALTESGAVTLLKYGKTSGVVAALDAASGLIKTAGTPTVAEQASEAKAEGDLLAAQQRIVACKANPSTCK